MRRLYLVLGLFSVALGAIGIFLPILPTVPFLILAAWCFGKSSPRFEQRLLDHPQFGPAIRAWREKGAIGRNGKWGASVAFATSFLLALALTPWPWPLLPLIVGLVAGSWIWSRPLP